MKSCDDLPLDRLLPSAVASAAPEPPCVNVGTAAGCAGADWAGEPQGTGNAGGGSAKDATNRMEVSAGVRVGFGSSSASRGACRAPRGERGLWVPSSPRGGQVERARDDDDAV